MVRRISATKLRQGAKTAGLQNGFSLYVKLEIL